MLDDFREWLSDNLRYILLGLAALLVIIICVCIIRLVGGSSKKAQTDKKTTAVTTSQKDEESTEGAATPSAPAPTATQELVHNDASILALAEKYYTAVAAKDSATLSQIVDPWNDTVEQETYNNDIEGYSNIATYSKDGPVDQSYLVYVYCECKIPNITTAVPSLRQLYVTTNESGDLIVSDWSQYQDFVTEANKSADVQALIKDVNDRCQELAQTDEDLKAYLTSQGIGGEKSTESQESTSGDTSAAGGSATATDGVNVRSEGSTNGTVLGTLYPGQEVKVVSKEGDWTHINYTDSATGSTIDGYVASNYLDFGSASTTAA